MSWYQDPIFGMKSAFSLYDGALSSAKLHLKGCQLGSLLSFQPVMQLLDSKIFQRAMHLAAGIQFAGLPVSLPTLWTIRDEDAPKVAHETYSYLLRNSIDGLDLLDAATASTVQC